LAVLTVIAGDALKEMQKFMNDPEGNPMWYKFHRLIWEVQAFCPEAATKT
jgi:hypothetical protein